MSSISAGTTTGTALVSTGDTTGELIIKTNGNTTAITVGADQNVVFESTGSITVPAGTTAERPATATAGMLRYNTETDELEKYDGTEWGSVGGAVTPAAVSSQANTATDYFDLPAGNTDQRPGSPAAGMVRFNTTLGEPEWYDPAGDQWLSFYQGANVPVSLLVVAGGGGATGGVGGVNYGSGGASGTVEAFGSVSLTRNEVYTVTVGSGGTGVVTGTPGAGNPSSFTGVGVNVTATGGSGVSHTSRTGGSNADYSGGTNASGVSSGGGAGSSANGSSSNGGAATSSSITGSAVLYAGGGAGYNSTTPGTAEGGGGRNANGTANTGGGAGGTTEGNSKNGGSGVVIMSVLTSLYSGSTTGSPTVTNSGLYTILKFTASGSYTA